ncbi:MAG TPA: hypothetical protein VNJ31_05845 [Methyloceanibacter sp.]|nr:hypothetical protein [Methyloceanibacter sp.]
MIDLLSLGASKEFHQQVDQINAFINENSIYKVDAKFWANRGNPANYAADLIAHAKDPSNEPAHMECSTRSNLMARVLNVLGFKTRIVALFSTDETYGSHSFLEVMNPETGRWETYDPTFNVYWRKEGGGDRISLAELAEVIDEIEPCGPTGCGWDYVNREGARIIRLKNLLDIIAIEDKRGGVKFAVYTSRADLNRTYSKGGKQGKFCEVQAKRCEYGLFDIREYSTYAPGLHR